MINQEICVPPQTTVLQALARLDATGFGALAVIDGPRLVRVVTDGDLRRATLAGRQPSTPLSELPSHEPICAAEGDSAARLMELMNQHVFDHIPVVGADRRLIDFISRRELSQRIWLSSPHLGDEETAFVEDAFRTNWIAPLGPHVDGFERELAAHVGVGHAAAVSSGTAAIHLALLLLGVKPGDTVFCSSLTFVGSCNPIMYCGAQPVFIDSDRETWNMSPAALEHAFEWAKKEGRLPRCVIVVNLYGQSADMDALLPICERYGVPVLEDAAESLGALYKGRASGSFGVIGVYSFNGNKIITTSGGGMLVANEAAVAERARKLATQAREPAPHYEHVEVGFNYRMSNVLAGIGRGQLRVLEQRVEQRREVFETYRRELADQPQINWMPEPEGYRSTRWLTCFTLQGPGAAKRRDAVLKSLERHSIEARPVWKPMHLQPLFRGAPYFPHSADDVGASLFEAGICLPSGSNLTAEQQGRVVDQLRRALAEDRRAAT
ncbi:aminotransferase class I/II-fold pyridoxal phosphate-dependent enzyme [Ramlibacter sp. WS9]|uniref:aminotransferase class I/II-fold pyridoxal phosphate-dependent enzyme n=1 Tax=Ramlibacter sp. WS9 TaxID=1882741 RepID=UPI00114244F2|nr:aminotransferase class I/II-fold pyridoxal phosphate-dependent enzyme [Ramlibacter sp. WS9]ROZ63658.1 aminotransferase class I/II-fold pyridoxal phosphate-dependent enzyme [Ramlibacter sp. WS9]